MELKHEKLKWISFLFASLRIFFGFVFILSATMKFIDLKAFAKALGDFKLLDSVQQLTFFTYAVPIVEIIIGIILILNVKTELFSRIATLLLAFFTTIIVAKIFEGEEISCVCNVVQMSQWCNMPDGSRYYGQNIYHCIEEEQKIGN